MEVDSAKPNSVRPRQYSLRFMLALVTAFAMLLGFVTYVRLNLPRWRAERVRLNAEYDQLKKG